jgi:hypothetical protein
MGRRRRSLLPQFGLGYVPSIEKPEVPFWMFRAAIRALASHTRSTYKMGRADYLLVAIERTIVTNPPLLFSSIEERQQVTSELEKVLKQYWDSCVPTQRGKHALLTILAHADKANELSSEYPARSPMSLRLIWLRKHLPTILKVLASNSNWGVCGKKCPRREDVTDDDLNEFSSCRGPETLADFLVAHHHGTTLEYLRQLYYGKNAKILRRQLNNSR